MGRGLQRGSAAGRRPGGFAAEAGFARLPAAGRRAACGPIPPPAGARTERIKRAETERSGSG